MYQEANDKIERKTKKFQTYIQSKWKNKKPLYKLFKSNTRCYLYDTGSNKILECDDKVFYFLEQLHSNTLEQTIKAFDDKYSNEDLIFTLDTIKTAIDNENILLAAEAKDFSLSDHYRNYKNLINNSLELLFLEITSQCNLRCKYCVYNDHITDTRNHGKEKMQTSVAQKAIDYLHEHSNHLDSVGVAFYGGEPLLEMPIINDCVKYSKNKIKGKKIEFSTTTNATLINQEIAEFLFKNNFKVLVSIDGPEKIHNRYRIHSNNKGSFNSTVNGLRTLIETYGESASKEISLSIVYAPPFSGKKLDILTSLWDEFQWLPKDIKITITYPSRGSVPTDNLTNEDFIEDINLEQWSFEKYKQKYDGLDKSNPISDAIVERGLALLFKRPIFSERCNQYYLNGCCVPGVRRLYVSPDGKFHVCERVSSNAPTIGDVESGVDFNVIKNVYIDGYESLSAPDCSKCWAVRLCSACYNDVFKNGILDLETKQRFCYTLKISKERYLKYYCTFLEENPNGLDYLKDYQLT